MDLTGVEVVSWDVDGTLYSLPKMKRAVLRRFAAQGVRGGLRRGWRELRALQHYRAQMRAARCAGGLIDYDAQQIDRPTLLRYERTWYAPALVSVGLRPGVRDLMTWFRDRGLRQIVLSDFVSTHKLEALGLADAFDAVYAGESLGYLKPAHPLFEQVLQKEGISATQLFHIGDRADTDGAAAAAAGARCAILGQSHVDPQGLLDALKGAARSA